MTGMGTVAAGMAVLYPAGVFLAADPLLVTVAIVGRGAFGEDSTDSISIKEVQIYWVWMNLIIVHFAFMRIYECFTIFQ